MEFRYEEADGGITVFISGQLTFKDHLAFNNHMDDIKNKKKPVVFDVANLEMVDSAGIGMFFLAQKLISANDATVSIKSPQGQVKRIFDITGINNQIEVID